MELFNNESITALQSHVQRLKYLHCYRHYPDKSTGPNKLKNGTQGPIGHLLHGTFDDMDGQCLGVCSGGKGGGACGA